MVNQAEDLHLSSATPADVAEFSSALTVDVDNETRFWHHQLVPTILNMVLVL